MPRRTSAEAAIVSGIFHWSQSDAKTKVPLVNPSESLVCIHCRGALISIASQLECRQCRISYPLEGGIADFAEGSYYDIFEPSHQLTEEHLRGLALEVEGSERRIRDFYAPLLRRALPVHSRVLDCGCGNGVSVDVLASEGFEAWGNDVSQLRKWQWRERTSRDQLVVASGLSLPFADGYFDAVVSSGVLEHIGVSETPAPNYSVVPTADQTFQRIAFLSEIARVVRSGGRIYLDFPNGAFPIDFWHGNAPGSARIHSTRERFLPRYGEVRELMRDAVPGATVRPISPRGRLQFRQSAAHLHGRLLRPLGEALFRAMQIKGLRWVAATAVNPFLVIEIEKP